ncbi:MAG: hypothetical protein KBS97_02485 [Firmicutes bacterium]|nr:hypothetical protein [Candidatus Fiminaster equi]
MPRVALTQQQKFKNQRAVLTEHCDLLLYKNHLHKKDVAEFVGLTPDAVCKQFQSKAITVEVAMAVFYLTNAGAEEIESGMKMRW